MHLLLCGRLLLQVASSVDLNCSLYRLMTTLSPTRARANLTSLLKRAANAKTSGFCTATRSLHYGPLPFTRMIIRFRSTARPKRSSIDSLTEWTSESPERVRLAESNAIRAIWKPTLQIDLRSRFAPLFVVFRKRGDARLHVLSTPRATVLAHHIFILALAFGGCVGITSSVV